MRCGDALHSGKQLVIAVCGSPAFLVPIWEMTQLDGEKGGLQRIEPAVVAFHLVIIFVSLAVIAKHPHGSRHSFVVGGYGARFSASTQVFPGIETERRRVAHAAGFFPNVFFFREVLGAM